MGNEIKSIYLAGKIHQNSWRFSILSNTANLTPPAVWKSKDDNGIFTPKECLYHFIDRYDTKVPMYWRKVIFGKFDYAGPYLIDCNIPECDYCGDHCHDMGNSEHKILEACQTSIAKADLIFAWIDDVTAYGTFAELGMAFSLGKSILISGPVYFDSLWFIYNLGLNSDNICNDIRDSQSPAIDLERLLRVYKFWSDETIDHPLYSSFSPIEKQFWDVYILVRQVCGIYLEPQYTIPGTRYRVDFAHIASKVAIELDGFESHSSTEQIANDRKRQREIEALGWRFIRFGGKEVFHDVGKCVNETINIISHLLKPKSQLEKIIEPWVEQKPASLNMAKN